MWRNILLGSASVTVFFVLAELGLRFSGQFPTGTVRSPDLETLDAIPGLFQPGLDLVDRVLPTLPYHVTINSLGFRGSEFSAERRPGVFRVLCIGDSYTFGPYVDDDETLPAVLDDLLNRSRQPAGGRAAEVINGGANGFTIEDELIFLESKGLALEPDLVILVFSQNDIRDLSQSPPQIDLMREHARLKSVILLGPILEALQHTAVFNGMQRAAARLRVSRPRAGDASDDPAPEILWDRYRTLLEKLSVMLDRNGRRLLLVAWPSARQISGELPLHYQERLERYASDLGIEYLDLAPAIRAVEAGGARAFLLPRDAHPSATGYAAAARAIAMRLSGDGQAAPREASAPVPQAAP